MRQVKDVTPTVTYNWYGREVRIDLAACHEALVRTTLEMDLSRTKAGPVSRGIQAFAAKVKLHPNTVAAFFGGDQVGLTSVNLILGGLGLRAQEVMERAS